MHFPSGSSVMTRDNIQVNLMLSARYSVRVGKVKGIIVYRWGRLKRTHILIMRLRPFAVKEEMMGLRCRASTSNPSSSFLSSLCLKRDNRKRKEEEDGMALCISTENADGKKYVIEIEGK